jgi:hypothetical protein
MNPAVLAVQLESLGRAAVRRCSTAVRSHASPCRMLSRSSTASPLRTRPRKAPPTLSFGSCRWSPTSTSLPSARFTASRSPTRSRVGTIPASSTTSTTPRGSARPHSIRSRSGARDPGAVEEGARHPLAYRLNDITPGERRASLREPARPDEAGDQALDVLGVEFTRAAVAHQSRGRLSSRPAKLGRSRAPVSEQVTRVTSPSLPRHVVALPLLQHAGRTCRAQTSPSRSARAGG